MPDDIRDRYDFVETRNAAKVIAASNPAEFDEVLQVLRTFNLSTTDITVAGGNKSAVARRLDEAFREIGWREGAHDLTVRSVVRINPYKKAGEKKVTTIETEVASEGYQVDNLKGRVALDVEWNAKDGNLDRDVGSYRALYDVGIIDGAIIITRSHESIRSLALKLKREKGFNTTTTTTIEKLTPRLARGDAGGCPVLAVAITDRCFVQT